MFDLSNKIAVITGASQGIGHTMANVFAKAGAKVMCIARSEWKIKELCLNISDEGGIAFPFVCDVGNGEAFSNTIKSITNEYGKLDILINNAGITRDAPLHKMSKDNWQKVIDVNLNSIFNMTSLVINKMRESNFGRIVHISSVNGQKGQFGQTNYAATKSALIGFSKSLALESASKGITSNVICPGYINTEMVAAIREDILKSIIETVPNKRLGEADEVAEMVGYLVSDKANYINGSTLSINGGLWMD